MSAASITALGAIAGFTIFLGLPIGRLQHVSDSLKVFLNAVAIGILFFLLFDVLAHINDPLEVALKAATGGEDTWSAFAWLATVTAAGASVGLLSLVYYEKRVMRRPAPPAPLAPADATGTLLVETRPAKTVSPELRLAFLIATGIGLHNFAEGLAIGQSAVQGDISLATLLIIGFGLHNATEGFGIVAPVAGGPQRPSWGTLGLLGIIGGGPTLVGTIVGQSITNDTLYLAFLALAAGSIIYVILQLGSVAMKMGKRDFLGWGVLLGLFAGFATDFILVAAGS